MSNPVKYARTGLIITIFSVAFVVLMSGCATQTGTRYESRSWKLAYKEVVIVNTEPQGAKIYCQDDYMGISPIRFTADCGENSVSVSQNGTYTASWTEEPSGLFFTETKRSSEQRMHATNWSGGLNFSLTGGQWTIKAFKDGYEPMTYTLKVSQDGIFNQACQGLKIGDDDKLYGNPVGSRSILLTLIPTDGLFTTNVAFTSEPADASIYVDGAYWGKTPCTMGVKWSSKHVRSEVRFEKPGYQTERQILTPNDKKINGVLQPTRPSER